MSIESYWNIANHPESCADFQVTLGQAGFPKCSLLDGRTVSQPEASEAKEANRNVIANFVSMINSSYGSVAGSDAKTELQQKHFHGTSLLVRDVCQVLNKVVAELQPDNTVKIKTKGATELEPL